MVGPQGTQGYFGTGASRSSWAFEMKSMRDLGWSISRHECSRYERLLENVNPPMCPWSYLGSCCASV